MGGSEEGYIYHEARGCVLARRPVLWGSAIELILRYDFRGFLSSTGKDRDTATSPDARPQATVRVDQGRPRGRD